MVGSTILSDLKLWFLCWYLKYTGISYIHHTALYSLDLKLHTLIFYQDIIRETDIVGHLRYIGVIYVGCIPDSFEKLRCWISYTVWFQDCNSQARRFGIFWIHLDFTKDNQDLRTRIWTLQDKYRIDIEVNFPVHLTVIRNWWSIANDRILDFI